ncbi:NAD(P)H-hydrate epimerase [Microbacteriaceae bacterium VKM Ac-2855]|nr:NAD(P)H-hydrate epimerase [Microbacteriaceae bacterium VKM Ac-2855]
MLLGYSAQQVRQAESVHLRAGEPLMQRAATALAREIQLLLAARPDRSRPPRVLVLLGSGDNGGDALFAAAFLAASGTEVWLVRAGSRVHRAGLAVALDEGCSEVVPDPIAVAALAARCDLVVDGLLGTGATAAPALRGLPRDIVAALLSVVTAADGPLVVAVDLPSGIHPDDGSVPDPNVLPADLTVTFGGIKAGLLLEPAAALAGRVRLIDIGLGRELAAMHPLVSR